MTAPVPALPRQTRTQLWWEIGIVLALSLGASAVYSVLTIIRRVLAETALADQSAGLNPTQSPQEWIDLTYQLLGIAFALAPVALVLYLLWRPHESAFTRIGLDRTKPCQDLGRGMLLFAAIGVPGIAFYVIGRMLGITVDVSTSGLGDYWWSIPVLILSALRAALLEEIIVVGYLFTRLRDLGWNRWVIIVAAAVLRGSYHLYQGFGPFLGNVAMGVLFGWMYTRFGRVAPLVVAHFLLDLASFLGYPLAVLLMPGIFGTA
ncbi:CPBP family intramembrane glutamic endopeptidase [Paramicrobacterium chengjingii]|uniref:CPBP family intramembrane metalloprotease n=1 Tax=Paramicrobacterium chengjingii TaxID=2769067 RepID=A0ABX6YLC3_9MICO|nr:CPBP family intramembrane glutamic endopeptidase [Microbacterium chengjingii]QPZ39623.1 CPBP family intramembrane metalloprotease [Microbacterium chengjingii]